jgi:hypothetical protein
MDHSRKDPQSPHRENFCRPEREGRKWVGGLTSNFLRGGGMDFSVMTQYNKSTDEKKLNFLLNDDNDTISVNMVAYAVVLVPANLCKFYFNFTVLIHL